MLIKSVPEYALILSTCISVSSYNVVPGLFLSSYSPPFGIIGIYTEKPSTAVLLSIGILIGALFTFSRS